MSDEYKTMQDLLKKQDFKSILELPEEEKDRINKEAAEYEQKLDAAVINKNFMSCGASRRYLENVGFDKFRFIDREEIKRAQSIMFNTARQYVQTVVSGKEQNYVLCGHPGCGKTYLALCILKAICGFKKDYSKYPAEWNVYEYRSGIYRTSDYLCEEIKQSSSFTSKVNKFQLIDSYATTDLLIVDEIGRADCKNEKEVLFNVLDRRYQEGKPSVLITNKEFKDLRALIGDALSDRLFSTAIIQDENFFRSMPSMRYALKDA